MPTSAPGNDAPQRLMPRPPRRRARSRGRPAGGFTMIELLIVIALIAVASSVVSLALRDPAAARLDQEAVRLSALLESARAEARASALPVRWEPTVADSGGEVADGFRFVGLPPGADLPSRWLTEGMSARIVGAAAVLARSRAGHPGTAHRAAARAAATRAWHRRPVAVRRRGWRRRLCRHGATMRAREQGLGTRAASR